MRRIIFGIILVGIAVSAVAQMLWQPSAESDALFAAGVDLYNVGKYREAIPLFDRPLQQPPRLFLHVACLLLLQNGGHNKSRRY